jgi:hypothetical protein
MAGSASTSDEKKAWTYAFLILLIISAAMLATRLMGREFLVLDFEVALIYFPTVLAGIAATYISIRRGD